MSLGRGGKAEKVAEEYVDLVAELRVLRKGRTGPWKAKEGEVARRRRLLLLLPSSPFF